MTNFILGVLGKLSEVVTFAFGFKDHVGFLRFRRRKAILVLWFRYFEERARI